MTQKLTMNRRSFLATTAASGAALSMPGIARAAGYPEGNINVYIPTAEGGGADRNFRAFTSVWKEKLGTEFEPSFYPGASGRVGYEIYMGKAEPDCYNLIFGNMGPEVLNWAMKAPDFNIDDYFYFGQVDKDPCCLFVGAESPLKTMDDILSEGKKRKLTVGTSRMAHPASIGLLALGEQVGVEFNLIPLQGGKGTVAGPVVGAILIAAFNELFVATLGASEINVLATGAIMMISLMFFPLGIVGTLAKMKKLPRFLNWD